MSTTRGRGTDGINASMDRRDHRIFESMRVFFTTIVIFLSTAMLRSATRSFRRVNHNFINIFSRLIIILRGFKVAMR